MIGLFLLLALGGACDREDFVLETETEQPRPPVVIEENNRFATVYRPERGDSLRHTGKAFAATEAGFFAVVVADSTLIICGESAPDLFTLVDRGLSGTGPVLERPLMVFDGFVDADGNLNERSLRAEYRELRGGELVSFTANRCSSSSIEFSRRDDQALVGVLRTTLFAMTTNEECSQFDSIRLEVAFSQPVTPCI